MAEEKKVFFGKVKHVGLFDFKELYEFLYKTLRDEDFIVFEEKYEEVNKGESKDLQIKWSAKKTISTYFQFQIKIHYIILGLKKVKVKRGNEEISTDSGTLELNFTTSLLKDPESEWDSSFMKSLHELYDHYVIHARVQEYEQELYERTNEFIAMIKSYLAIEGQHSW